MHTSSLASAQLPVGSATLTFGPWAERFEHVRDRAVPTMRDDLFDDVLSGARHNFEVATGRADGAHQGPPFLDGDLYKWLEAAVALLAQGDDPELDTCVEDLVSLIAEAQRADGYLHTPTQIAQLQRGADETLADRLNFETYNLGHLMTAACLHHAVTGRTTLLAVAERAAGFLINLIADNPDLVARSAICPSHYMGTVELFRTTGDSRYLQLARDLITLRDRVPASGLGGDDNQDRLTFAETEAVVGHAVRSNYLYAGIADLLLEEPDEDVAARLTRLWEDVANAKVYLTGGHGALYDGASPDGFPWQEQITKVHQSYGRPYQLPQITAHNETCATIGNMLWSWRMLLRTGEVRYADSIEVAVNNTLFGSIGIGDPGYFYTNPLRQVGDLPYPLRRAGDTALDPVPAPPPSDERLRQRYLSCFCCPPNIVRTIARLSEYCYSALPDGLMIHQYAGGRGTVTTADGELAVEQHTDYPRSGTVRIVVTAAPSSPTTLAIRVPTWAVGATLSLNGEAVDAIPGRYAKVRRGWSVGDEIVLELPLSARKLVSHALVEETTNQVAIQRGPVVYCVESTDLPDGVRPSDLLIPRHAEFTEATATIDGAEIVTLSTVAARRPAVDPDALYADLPTDDPTDVAVTLIPYAAWANRGASEMSVWLPLRW
ncbi:glycoside hydrolase family 127 protein [Tessaracoccus defluvii]